MTHRDQPDDRLLRQQRMEALNRLAAGVAHEFNNVLQIVRGYVAFARDSLTEHEGPFEDLGQALKATDRAADLSRRLLQFARCDEEESSPADAADAIEALRLLLKPIIGENIRIEIAVESDLPDVLGGDAWLRQALLNLCVNARDAMPTGGVLKLEAVQHEGPIGGRVVAGEPPSEPCVKLTISDTGEGMDDAMIPRAFEPFFTTKQPGEGTGLGLPMVASLVTRVSGAMTVESSPGAGTQFDLYLPIAPECDLDAHEVLPSPSTDPLPLACEGGV